MTRLNGRVLLYRPAQYGRAAEVRIIRLPEQRKRRTKRQKRVRSQRAMSFGRWVAVIALAAIGSGVVLAAVVWMAYPRF